ncbi:MAG: GNAT family N-acetyltransferase [Chloroflexota bacterium]
MPPVLQTDRLRLRMVELTDAPAIQHLANDPLIARNTLTIRYPYPEGLAEEWLRETMLPAIEAGEDYLFAMTLRETGEFMGVLGMHNRQFDRMVVGYWIGKPYRGNGYTPEALRRVIAFGFDELGLNRIYAEYFPHNPASRRVMEKAGMRYEGTLRQHVCKDGEYLDEGICGILREDYH